MQRHWSGELTRRYVKKFMDIVILALLNEGPMHGYELIASIHSEFGTLVSPGAVYPLLHSMEKDGLIVGKVSGIRRKRVYSLTREGSEALLRMAKDLGRVQDAYSSFLRSARPGRVQPPGGLA